LSARIVALAVALVALAAPAAHASWITFGCRYDLCRATPTGKRLHRLTHFHHQSTPHQISISTDGRRLTFGNVLANGNARARRTLKAQHGEIKWAPQVSSSGRKLVWLEHYSLGGPTYLCQGPFAGGRPRCRTPAGFITVHWGPGSRLIGLPEDAGTGPCYIVAGRCGRPVILANGVNVPVRPSPDGRLLAASVDEAGGRFIGIFSVRTRRLVRKLTRGPSDMDPSWSPDGRQIVFTRHENETPSASGEYTFEGEIAVVGARGGPVRHVARGVAPVWSR
jgi:hypothetical protein